MVAIQEPVTTLKPAAKVLPGKKTKPYISPYVSLAGGVAGGFEAAMTYPFEFAKTKVQLRGNSSTTNPLLVIRNVVQSDGIRALYTGCSKLVVGTAFKASVRFLSFDSIRNVLADDAGKLSPARGILAGMCAGIVESVVAVNPHGENKNSINFLRIDDAKREHRFHGGLHAARTMIKESGVSALYRGLLWTTAKQCSTSAVRMGSYNVLRESLKERGVKQTPVVTFATGAVAGTVTVYATQPFDTMKTRSQAAVGAKTSDAIKSILSENGVRGFWKGSTMRLGRLVFSGGIVFSVYEQVAALLIPLQKQRML
ncbi:mitochondrial carrier [Mollisia scopiformis]|uniref:Mitochondrial carrier n=1 Tax=Mollisia scopiformis TaxID=149040 RepID=A0A132B5U7_MOLSC|nr:mitochondrial carrier [Mollisia scopiformis]KUJ07786.1 mitochondrial carrier [Mollisia scopiformis]